LNGKENGMRKWTKSPLNPSPLTLFPESTLFSFFALKIEE